MYCVYLTIYSGNRLPPFYIGSSSVEKVKSGYNGSVTSKKYGRTWRSERENNKHLFRTLILSTHEKRKDATRAEARLQEARRVVASELYVNLAVAKVNGFFCNGTRGEAHPTHRSNYSPTQETRKKISEATSGGNNGMFGKRHDHLSRKKMSESWARRTDHSNMKRAGEKNAMWGKKHPPHVIEAIRLANLGSVKSKETKAKLSAKKLGTKWWNNGAVSKMSVECPGDGWKRGRC